MSEIDTYCHECGKSDKDCWKKMRNTKAGTPCCSTCMYTATHNQNHKLYVPPWHPEDKRKFLLKEAQQKALRETMPTETHIIEILSTEEMLMQSVAHARKALADDDPVLADDILQLALTIANQGKN